VSRPRHTPSQYNPREIATQLSSNNHLLTCWSSPTFCAQRRSFPLMLRTSEFQAASPRWRLTH
jgi:hypothetical protein